MRRDAWPVIGAIAAFAALVTVSWKATPDRSDVELILYIGGLAFTVVGTVAAALDVRRRVNIYRDGAKQARTAEARQLPRLSSAAAELGLPASRASVEQRHLEQERQARRSTEARLAALNGATDSLWQLGVSVAVALIGVGLSGAADILTATH